MADRAGHGRPLLAAAALALAACGAEEPAARRERTTTGEERWYEEASRSLGIEFVHDAGVTEEKQLPETMGSGAALVDVDEDGLLDLYLVQGGPLPRSLSAEDRTGMPTNRLFLARPGGGFEDATERSGDGAHAGYGMGVAPGDADGDGHVDLYLTNLGPDALLLGDGTGRFRDATAEAGLGDPRWTTGATFLDPDEDGDLDLYVLGYLEVDLADPPFCGRREPGWRSYCHPDLFAGIQDRYWRNDGGGRFEDATVAAGFADSAGKGLGVAVLDFDDDGHVDLYVANDSVENRLWRGRGDGTFEDATLLSATGVNGTGATEAGMGVATGDADGDGRVDLFVTNFDDESNTLYRNEGDGFFRDATVPSGLDAPSRLPVGFGTVLIDMDSDGDLDLAVANGHIVDNIELYHDGKTWAQRAQLFENRGGGRFVERKDSALGDTPLVGRGLYAGDLDGDGDDDLVLTQCGGPVRVFLRRGASPAWRLVPEDLATRLRVTLADGRVLVRDAVPQTSYLGSSAPGVVLPAALGRPARLEARAPGGSWTEVDLSGLGAPGVHRLATGAGSFRLEPASMGR